MTESSKVVKTAVKPPNAGKGRVKGTPNKTTALLKDAILKAADDAHSGGIIGYLTDQAQNKYAASEPRYVLAAQAMAAGRTPYSFVYNDLFNSPQGPFLQMLQKAVFDGDIDGAVAEAQRRFRQVIATGG